MLAKEHTFFDKMAKNGDDGDQSTMTMRGHVQRKFLDDMIDCTGRLLNRTSTNLWLPLILVLPVVHRFMESSGYG